MNTIIRYRAPDLSEASVSLKVFENPEHGLHHVLLSLPAGMDIAPDVWRFQRAGDAERHFLKTCRRVESYGFQPIGTASV